MGRIKSLMVKKAAKQLLALEVNTVAKQVAGGERLQSVERPASGLQQKVLFSESFSHNKNTLGSTMPSKPIRNKIAGYIARLKKAKRLEASRPPRKVVPIEESQE